MGRGFYQSPTPKQNKKKRGYVGRERARERERERERERSDKTILILYMKRNKFYKAGKEEGKMSLKKCSGSFNEAATIG